MKKTDPRLQPWLDLGIELEELDRFMRMHNLAPTITSPNGKVSFLDSGGAVAQRIREIKMNQWTWFGWKRDRIEGEISGKLHTFQRWIAEGFFFGCDETEVGREMLERIEKIEHKFKQLTEMR